VLLVDREPVSIRKIVLGKDGSASAREAVRLLSLCPFAATSRVLALGIVNTSWRRTTELDEFPPAGRRAVHEIEAQHAQVARAVLARTAAALADRATVESEVAMGSPAQVLLNAARQRSADLVVLGHQGTEPVRRLALGSVAEQLLAAATCSLLIGRK
jgi:nucleotide-binding universal stress UspA family protein